MSQPEQPTSIPTIHTQISPKFQDQDHQYDKNMDYTDRLAVRAVLRYPVNQEIALIHSALGTYLKLPGAQIEADEDHRTALARIILEETGCEIDMDIGEPFLKVEGWCKVRSDYIHETSFCYKVRVKGLVRKFKRFSFNLFWGPIPKMKHRMRKHTSLCTTAWGTFSLFTDLHIMEYYTGGLRDRVVGQHPNMGA